MNSTQMLKLHHAVPKLKSLYVSDRSQFRNLIWANKEEKCCYRTVCTRKPCTCAALTYQSDLFSLLLCYDLSEMCVSL